MFDVNADYVVSDDRQAAILAVRRLLGFGHRRIAFVGGDPSVSCFAARLAGYKEALGEAAIAFDDALVRLVCPRGRPVLLRHAGLPNWAPRPTAAICSNDSLALGFISGLRHEGLHPGTDFALIGHENIEEAGFVSPSLSSTAVSREEMGRMAAAVLLERVTNPDAPLQRHVLRPNLSSGKPARFPKRSLFRSVRSASVIDGRSRAGRHRKFFESRTVYASLGPAGVSRS